jgi:hypothetical protein
MHILERQLLAQCGRSRADMLEDLRYRQENWAYHLGLGCQGLRLSDSSYNAEILDGMHFEFLGSPAGQQSQEFTLFDFVDAIGRRQKTYAVPSVNKRTD